jgi:hypothetical protein
MNAIKEIFVPIGFSEKSITAIQLAKLRTRQINKDHWRSDMISRPKDILKDLVNGAIPVWLINRTDLSVSTFNSSR